ncbi:MAG: cell wall hydrolase [Rhizobiaceae bacterium]
MRTFGTRLLGGALGSGFAICLATVANITAVSPTSLQDIADLTGAKTHGENRWLARLVEIPTGADFQQADGEDGTRKLAMSHAMAVQTAEAVHTLDKEFRPETGKAPGINRAMKGDRVFQPKKQGLTVAGMHSLTTVDPIVTGSLASQAGHSVLAAASTFRRSLPAIVTDKHGATALASLNLQEFEERVHGRIPLATDHMKQAREVAKMMTAALHRARTQKEEAESLTDVPAVATAYAPATSKQENAMASAFAAVLRSGSGGSRVKIRLAKGDHKWADDPLPKYSYSKAERHCLANGVYFEARGEPILGQKAVAQVILNRVRNPAYPKTVCGVVYQNKRKRNACQFSFACDGIRDRINSPKHWRNAVNVANSAIDGKFWLRSVGSASHYHADYVWPKWRRKMRKMTKIGRHIFYRTFGGGWS